MHGVGRATAALTIVNALPTGVGCALGLGLSAEAEVEVRRTDGSVPQELRIAPESRTTLVETAARLALARYLSDAWAEAELTVRSGIPVARGLKSSSAVASAVVSAVAHAAGAVPSAVEVALLSAEIGRASGVSATGAFDDALAGLRPGFCLTDNREGRLLRSVEADPDWEAAVLVPARSHGPSPKWTPEFARVAREGARIVDLARSGDLWGAMGANSELVERVMGYEYGSLRAELRAEGALGAGVSGLGPALVAVAPRARTDRMLELLGRLPGQRLRLPIASSSQVGSPEEA